MVSLDQQMHQKCSATKLLATPFTAVVNQVYLKEPTYKYLLLTTVK
jgi:hypothetical protein